MSCIGNKEIYNRKRITGLILLLLGIPASAISLINFVPAYSLAIQTFPNDPTWQQAVNWAFITAPCMVGRLLRY